MLRHRHLRVLGFVALTHVASAAAVCPVCTVAVGAGLGLSRWLGVDDTISGLWIGGLTIALSLWAADWLAAHGVTHALLTPAVTLATLALTIAGLYLANMLAVEDNTLWGVDKLLSGIALGAVVFYGGARIYAASKAAHGGHARYPFEKVVLPVAPLLIVSVLLQWLLP